MMSEQITSIQVKNWLLLFADRVAEYQTYLTELDAKLGDADHGINLQNATDILRQRLAEIDLNLAKRSPEALLRLSGIMLINHIGGAAGPLYGAFFLSAAKSITHATDTDKKGGMAASPTNRSVSPLLIELTSLFAHGLKGIQQRGRVKGGEKTMADALIPAVQSMQDSMLAGLPIHDAMNAARAIARQGMEQTTEQKALKGHASYLGTRSIGHQDPGATSIYLLIETAAEVFGGLEQNPLPTLT